MCREYVAFEDSLYHLESDTIYEKTFCATEV